MPPLLLLLLLLPALHSARGTLLLLPVAAAAAAVASAVAIAASTCFGSSTVGTTVDMTVDTVCESPLLRHKFCSAATLQLFVRSVAAAVVPVPALLPLLPLTVFVVRTGRGLTLPVTRRLATIEVVLQAVALAVLLVVAVVAVVA